MKPGKKALSRDILPSAVTMIGTCITAISLIKLIEHFKRQVLADEILEIDSLFFVISACCSYLAMRKATDAAGLEQAADLVFLVGLVVMVVAILVLGMALPTF